MGAGGDDSVGKGERGSKAEISVNSRGDGNKFDGKDTDNQGKKRKNRCALCRKKVGLTDAGQKWEQNERVHQLFTDFNKAYDLARREVLYNILTGFECRCGGLFCEVHRYTDRHICTFDYREMGAQEIRRNNPLVVCEKIQQI